MSLFVVMKGQGQMTTYDDVNAAWPADLPTITVADAGRVAQRLWRSFASKEGARAEGLRRYKRKPRRCWGSTDRTRNSLSAGWRRTVHDVSHIMLEQANPLVKAHGTVHAELELRLIRHVLDKGWLAPKPVKPKPDPRAVRHARVLAAIERWEAKARRADRALRKLARQRRYYEQATVAG